MKTQKTEQPKQSLERVMELEESAFLTSDYTILQSYTHQDSMVVAQKQKYRPMKQDRKPISKPMHLWVPYF